MDAPGLKVVLDNGIDEEVVALFGSIAPEGARAGTFVHGTVHGLNGCVGQGLGDVADAETDEVGVGVGCLIGVYLPGNLSKEITWREFLIVGVDVCHVCFCG